MNLVLDQVSSSSPVQIKCRPVLVDRVAASSITIYAIQPGILPVAPAPPAPPASGSGISRGRAVN
jgi:hypothetical protein